MSQETLEGEKGFTSSIHDILRQMGCPVTVGFVAKKMRVSWSTARHMLFELTLNDELSCIETSNGRVFTLREKDSGAVTAREER